MTLLVTELSKNGIVMVAETGLPPLPRLPGMSSHCLGDSEAEARMVWALPSLQVGVAVWGCRCVRIQGTWVGVHRWVDDCIHRSGDDEDVAQLADRLADELSALPHLTDEPMGVHLAGYVGMGDERSPVLYHVRNNDTDFQVYHLYPFRATRVFAPVMIDDQVLRSASSDVGGYGRLWAWAEQELPAIDHGINPNLPLPQESLDGRMACLAARVQLVSGLYAAGTPEQFGRSRYEVLGISPDGQIHERTILEADDRHCGEMDPRAAVTDSAAAVATLQGVF